MPKANADDVLELTRLIMQSYNATDAITSMVVMVGMMAKYLPAPAQRRIVNVMLEEMSNLRGGTEAILGSRIATAELLNEA